jgi:hypothetical protein
VEIVKACTSASRRRASTVSPPPPKRHAHTLNAPGKFLIAAVGYETPKRARACLLTDAVVAETVARYAEGRPPLDEVSQQAIGDNHSSERIIPTPQPPPTPDADENVPDELPWASRGRP